ncbi:MFS transporter [Nostocales cyanobacterium HT-58-2]|nr:MFS transporter [Nostocales cyanobacterium HT-58-2]
MPDLQAKPRTLAASQRWLVMLSVSLGVFMSTLDVGIINVALPTLVQYFQTSFPRAQWAVLAYQLISSSLVLGATRLGDIWGKKHLFLSGLIVFTVSSLLCGIAPSIDWLIGFRSLQGLGSLFISGLGLAIVTEVFPSSERGRAVGIIGSVVSLGVALGPSIGGLLLGWADWRILFLINVPLGFIASFLVGWVVPASKQKKEKQRFDLLGTLLALVTLSNFALGMTFGQSEGFNSGSALWLLFLAAIALVSFLAVEVLLEEPLLELQIFRNSRLSVNLLNNWLVFIVLTGGLLITPFFLERVKQYPTSKVGLLLAVSPVVSGLIAPVAGTLSDRFGSRLICLIGLGLMIGSCLGISTLDTQSTEQDYVLRYLVFGTGLGLFRSPNDSTVMGAVPRDRLGIASGLLSLSRTLGVNVGVSVIGAVFGLLITNLAPGKDVSVAPAQAVVAGFQGSYRLAALILCGAAVTTAVVKHQKSKGESYGEEIRR